MCCRMCDHGRCYCEWPGTGPAAGVMQTVVAGVTGKGVTTAASGTCLVIGVMKEMC